MEELLKQILGEIKGIKEEVKDLKGDVKDLKTGQQQIIERIDNLEGQTRENTDIIKAVQHNTEVLNAKVDGLTVNTANKESIANLDAKFDVLNNRLFQQEADLQRLKKAQ